MKNALIVASTAGFLPQFLDNDVKVLMERGYTVHYASDFFNPVYKFDREDLESRGIVMHPITLHKKPWHLIKNFKGLTQLSKIIKDEDIKVVHCHNPVGGMLGRMAGVWSGKKPFMLYTAHGFHFFDGAPKSYWLMFYPAEKYLAKMTDVIITINKEDFFRAKNFKMRDGGKVELLHGVGLDTERFHPMPEIRYEVRSELGIPEDAFHIVTAAELNGNKNQETVIKAIAQLNDSNIYYSICGRGPGKENLEQLIAELGLKERVKLLGYREDMERVLQSADVFAFPSIREGFGMAAVEALGCGIPVIAADNRGTREYMHDGDNGIVCAHDNVDAFAAAIINLKVDENLRKEYSRKAYKLSKIFWKESAKKTMDEIYDRVDRIISI